MIKTCPQTGRTCEITACTGPGCILLAACPTLPILKTRKELEDEWKRTLSNNSYLPSAVVSMQFADREIYELRAALALEQAVRLQCANDSQANLDRALSAEAKLATARADERERPRIVCLCGSTRFIAEMACIAWGLERDEGYITLGLHLLPDNYPGVQPDHMAEAEGRKEHFDELHKRKIDLADEVLVVNIGGYIGESTRSEINYAITHNKPVKYLEKTQ